MTLTLSLRLTLSLTQLTCVMIAIAACSTGVNSAIVVDVLSSTRCVQSDSVVDDTTLYSRHLDISKIAPFSIASVTQTP